MSESLRIDSPFRGWAMPKSYSADLRERVIEAVEMGASRHEAADRFEASVSSAGKGLPRGGGRSARRDAYFRWLAVGKIACRTPITIMKALRFGRPGNRPFLSFVGGSLPG